MKADLPVVYRKCSAYFAAFPCSLKAIRPLFPHPMLTPITLAPGKGVLVATVFDHRETSIGAYREVGIGFMARLRTSGPLPLLPLLADRWFEDVGTWMQFLSVTTPVANDLARATLGLPSNVADIQLDRTDDHVTCEVTDGGRRLLQIHMDRPGVSRPTALPLRLYSALGDDILFTEMAVDAFGATTRLRPSARLELTDHPLLRDVVDASAGGAKPLEVRWFDDYRTILDRPSIRYRMSA